MNERPYWHEWPLAVFTVAVQVSCGLALVAIMLDWRAGLDEQAIARTTALSVFPTLALGVLASLLHLGRPLSSWRALSNAKRSRLSQEVVAVTTFGCSALAYGAMWYGGAHSMRLACGLVTVLLGILAVVTNARVYRLPAQPQARRWWMIVSLFSMIGLAATLWPVFSRR